MFLVANDGRGQKALVQGCPRCHAFEGAVPKAPLCPIRAHTPLELVHVDFTSVESMIELNKPPSVKNILVITDHFIRYALAVITKDQTAKTVARVLYERFIMVFSATAKLLSDWGQTLPWHLWKSCVPCSAPRNAGPPCTTRNAMDKLSIFIKCSSE